MDNTRHVSLCEVLDRVLDKGAVVSGEITLSVANIDLVYLGLQIVVTSIETARNFRNPPCPITTKSPLPPFTKGGINTPPFEKGGQGGFEGANCDGIRRIEQF